MEWRWHGLGAPGRVSVQELGQAATGGHPQLEVVTDLDHFVDNYLSSVHGDNVNLARGHRLGVGEVSLLGHGATLSLGGQQPGLGFGAGLGASLGPSQMLALLQQQQQQQQLQEQQLQQLLQQQPLLQQQQLQQLLGQQPLLQQQQLQQRAIDLLPGQGLGASAVQPMSMPSSKPNAAAPAAKGGRGKGKANTKQQQQQQQQSMKADAESCSGSESGDDGSSDEEPRGRKRQNTGAPMDDAERRHQALQEKNRRAQRRFRERQKAKLQELHKQIEELSTKVTSLQSENLSLYSRTNILEKVLDMRNEQIQVMQETKEGVVGRLVQLTPENIKELGSEQITKIYQLYVKELSVRLVEGQENMQELEALVQDLCALVLRLGVIKPLETRKFIVMSRQCLGSSEAEVMDLWKTLLNTLELNDQQKRDTIEMKRAFLRKIEPVMEERKTLNMQIQANLPHDTFATKNALTYIKAHEAVIKLRDNLRMEQRMLLEFAMSVFREVFRPAQTATLLVKCFPAVPDALGIASALGAEFGEADVPQARQLTMQLGGYLESSSLAWNSTMAGSAAAGIMAGGMGNGLGQAADGLQGLNAVSAVSSLAGTHISGNQLEGQLLQARALGLGTAGVLGGGGAEVAAGLQLSRGVSESAGLAGSASTGSASGTCGGQT